VERGVLSRLVNYGERELVFYNDDGEPGTVRLDEFVIQDMERDLLEFEEPLHRRFYNIYKEEMRKDPAMIRQRMVSFPEDEIRQFYTSLQDVKPSYSSGWEKRKNFIHTVDDSNTDLLREDMINVLHNLRLLKLRRVKAECESQLKSEKEEEEMLALLAKIQRINQFISEIENKLGVTYR